MYVPRTRPKVPTDASTETYQTDGLQRSHGSSNAAAGGSTHGTRAPSKGRVRQGRRGVGEERDSMGCVEPHTLRSRTDLSRRQTAREAARRSHIRGRQRGRDRHRLGGADAASNRGDGRGRGRAGAVGVCSGAGQGREGGQGRGTRAAPAGEEVPDDGGDEGDRVAAGVAEQRVLPAGEREEVSGPSEFEVGRVLMGWGVFL